jgi:hypothetical protein
MAMASMVLKRRQLLERVAAATMYVSARRRRDALGQPQRLPSVQY